MKKLNKLFLILFIIFNLNIILTSCDSNTAQIQPTSSYVSQPKQQAEQPVQTEKTYDNSQKVEQTENKSEEVKQQPQTVTSEVAPTQNYSSGTKESKNVERIVYITKTGKKYHREGCRYLSRSQIPVDLSVAVSQGYEPCKVCRP